MHVPSQLTVDGAQEPLQAPQPLQSGPAPPQPLFTAPQTVRGQLAMPTDQATLVRASLLACPDTNGTVQR